VIGVTSGGDTFLNNSVRGTEANCLKSAARRAVNVQKFHTKASLDSRLLKYLSFDYAVAV
jgi:hypothetical protein